MEDANIYIIQYPLYNLSHQYIVINRGVGAENETQCMRVSHK